MKKRVRDLITKKKQKTVPFTIRLDEYYVAMLSKAKRKHPNLSKKRLVETALEGIFIDLGLAENDK